MESTGYTTARGAEVVSSTENMLRVVGGVWLRNVEEWRLVKLLRALFVVLSSQLIISTLYTYGSPNYPGYPSHQYHRNKPAHSPGLHSLPASYSVQITVRLARAARPLLRDGNPAGLCRKLEAAQAVQ
ncbi:uncharacterized protein PHACADRAFT_263123 [Phanerochaete carnosa HHB-10118-sp]|uniref:Uncharacterized protein n=1 Tax=Phanerochaete carnosa (strain HHB-10118-sp) TaxID=650164 RepID=K5VWZ4_PHACS|nr:uncharacterized protein PHACADRAFT_263123 [Phanerochaete carnosa HHB-10118-sp]EKM51129.1 hypothetical protein PHACADRAFT_263123 [Phanerochaete carnosa HHB-10118-sp]